MQKTALILRKCMPLVLLAVMAGCSANPDNSTVAAVSSANPDTAPADVVVTDKPASIPVAEDMTAEEALTTKQRLADFEYMHKILKENYPFFAVNKRVNGVDWLANEESYKEQIAAAGTDKQFYAVLQNILADLHNGHSYILNKGTYKKFRQLYDNEPESKPWSEVLQQNQVELRYGVEAATSKPGENNTASTPVPAAYRQPNIFHRTLEPGKSAYLWIKGFASEHIEADSVAIRRFLTEVKDYQVLILDIRGNPGGSMMYWMNLVAMLVDHNLPYKEYLLFRGGEYAQPFIASSGLVTQPIKELERKNMPNTPPETDSDFPLFMPHSYNLTPDPVGYKGKIFLLVDGGVYSASEAFATYAKSTGFATLIGEKTGGDGIGATPLVAALPNSGYVLNFPYVLGLTADGSADDEYKTEPDVWVNAAKNKDWHKDEAVQKALELAYSD